MWYEYDVAGLHILCSLPFPLTILDESKQFLFPVLEEEKPLFPDLTVTFCPVSELPPGWRQGYRRMCRYYCEAPDKNYIYFCPDPESDPYGCMIWDKANPEKAVCYYKNGKEYYIHYSRNICDILGMETVLQRNGGFMIHASFIRWQEKAILFSAPSGTGKSTQADLWVKYEEAEIINGDKAGLRRAEEGWYAYGLPYAGSSGIYRNEKAPVAAVIALRQARENRIRRLKLSESFRYLYPEITLHQWDREFVGQIISRLSDFLGEVPVYLLECLPDEEAVRLTKDIVLGQGIFTKGER